MYIFFYIVLFFLVAYAVLIDYYRRAWENIPVLQVVARVNHEIIVTIIIPARNEEKNIANCIQSILQQSYPLQLIELIVVNDHSTDRTEEIIKNFQHPSIKLINLQEHIEDAKVYSYKKKAIETAIAQSLGELIITTDADCIAPHNWVEYLVELYDQQDAAFIAAPVKIKDNHSLLSIFQCLDFITLQGITGASVQKKMYSLCNGANLAYQKKAFQEVEGFSGIDSIASGDDMLLMYKIYKKFPDKIYFAKSQDAIINTEPMTNWKSFFHQRIRWSSKADKYEDRRVFWTLLAVYLLNLSILFFLIAGFFDINSLLIFLILIITKTIIEFPFVYTVADFFGQKYLMIYFFFLQPLHLFYIVIIGALGKFTTYQWKGRKINQ